MEKKRHRYQARKGQIYELYLKGFSIEQAVKQTGTHYVAVQNYYTNFGEEAFLQRALRREDRVAQIYMIESELFKLYESKRPQDLNRIAQLEFTYVHFNATT